MLQNLCVQRDLAQAERGLWTDEVTRGEVGRKEEENGEKREPLLSMMYSKPKAWDLEERAIGKGEKRLKGVLLG
ncbi:Uncharacterized protein TCM_033605 [Theobroma cacao]|uniref:Uncharacterized protein n=1 Tax=Theobroma cacao TaxID=3641 RepID=A0A061FBL3_THECC|nr:Uncharacterized protein TCM_033605 [Theobroma cacao]